MAFSAINKRKKCLQTASSLLQEYAERSSIHGVSYITENGRSRIEKGWWICVLSVSVFICVKLVYNASNISPIIISFTDKPTPVWQIPFPAVTICPSAVALWSLTIIEEIGEEYFNNYFTEQEKLLTLAVNAFCADGWLQVVGNYTNCNDCLKLMRQIKIPPEEFFVECKFKNVIFNCTEALEEVIFQTSLCYTFNGLPLYRHTESRNSGMTDKDWSLDDGYNPSATASAYPHRVFSAGPKYGLSILLRSPSKYFDPACRPMGFWVEYRMPYESPQFKTNFFMLSMEKSLNIVLKPKILVISGEMRGFASNERKCYFSNERPLKYFRKYTQSNCELECEADLMLKHCNTLPIYIENQHGIDVLGPKTSACAHKGYVLLFKTNHQQCECLPLCSSAAYESEIFMGKLHNSTDEKDEAVYYSRLNIYFKENQLMTIKRTVRYGKTEFLANCGGLLGLCLGISILSIVELIYFFTIRLWIIVQRAGSGNKIVTRSQKEAPNIHRFKDMIKQLIKDYFSKTTLQGVKYVSEVDLSKAERIWWAIVVGISVFCCGSLISKVLRRYDQAPVIISYANEETPISQIPYPAVTICPQIFSNNVKNVFDYFKVYNRSLYALNRFQYEAVTAIAQVCDPANLSDLDPKNLTDCANCRKTLKVLVGNTDKFFSYCRHITVPDRCSDMFETVVTENGVCFVYNALQSYRNSSNTTEDDITDMWSLDYGYRNNTGDVDVRPRAGSKFSMSLSFLVLKYFQDNLCNDAIQGFKLYLHMPNETPQMSKHFYLLPYQHYTQIMINPRLTVTAPELRDHPVTKRQCYFSQERNLRFFRHYTQNNCEIECLANLTISRCGCLMFYLPKIEGVKFCGISEILCQENTAKLSVEQNIKLDGPDAGCQCLPTCTSIFYDTEMNHVFYTDQETEALYDKKFIEFFRFLYVDIVFQKNEFVALRRSQLYGKTEILANCGGLLGLFLGFSFISILELFYFCTIRFCCEVKKMFSNGFFK